MTDSKIQVGMSDDYLNTNLVETDAGWVHNEVIDQGNIISDNNSRAAATLAADTTWTGTGEDVSRFGRVGVSFKCDNAAPGTLWMEVSHDGISYGGPPRTVTDPSTAEPHMWNIVEKYFRIRYVNGSTEATNLSIQVQYSNNANVLLGHQLDQALTDPVEAIITRSVLVGKTRGGVYKNVPVDLAGHLHTDVPTTAFGDLRVAELSPIYQISFEYTVDNTEIGVAEVTGSGTVTQSDAMCVCSTGTTTGSRSEWETSHNARYRAGLGGLFRGTAMFTAGVAGTEQILGIADTEGSSATHKNGYAVGYNGATFGFFRWSNDTLDFTALADWDDPLDGTGPSGMTLDPTKLNVYFIQYQFLGAGAIKVWVENDSTGLMDNVHTSLYANLNTTPSNYNPNFHLMVHAENLATTEDMTIKSSSLAYFVEGKSKYMELQQPQHTSERRTKSSVTSETAIFTIRNKTTYASKTNFIDLVLQGLSSSIEASGSNNLGAVRVVKNTTLGGTPSWSDINTTDSICEIDTSGTTLTGGKTMLTFDLAGKNDRAGGNLTDYEIVLSPGDTVTVAGLSAASATINASLLWRELF